MKSAGVPKQNADPIDCHLYGQKKPFLFCPTKEERTLGWLNDDGMTIIFSMSVELFPLLGPLAASHSAGDFKFYCLLRDICSSKLLIWINYTDFKSVFPIFLLSFSLSLSLHAIMPKRQWLTAHSRWNIMILLEADRHFELSGLPLWIHAHMHTLTLRSGVNHSISVMKYSLTAVSKLCRWTSLINFCHSSHTHNKSPWKPCLER